jgi:hypothetical protein
VRALERAANEVGRKFQYEVLSAAPMINKQLDTIAKKYGLDPSYVRLIFIRPTRFWPTMNPKEKAALIIAKKIVVSSGEVPSLARAQIPPVTMEENVDAALTELARWSQTTLKKYLNDKYLKVVKTVARPYLKILRREEDPDPPMADVGSQISGYFKWKLRTGRETSPRRLLMLRVLEDL